MFFVVFHKDKDKRKLIFGLGFLLSSYYYIFIVFNIGVMGQEPMILNNIRSWASLPILIALVFAVSERYLQNADLNRLFRAFIGLVLVTFIVYLLLPAATNFYVTSITNSIFAAYILILSFYLLLKAYQLEYMLFLLAVLCLGVAGVAQNYGANDGVAIFAFFMGNIFVGLVFHSLRLQRKNMDSSLMDYFALKKELSKTKNALDEREKNFRALFNEMVDAVAIINTKGTILELTDNVSHITGYANNELLGKNFLSLPLFDGKTKRHLLKVVMSLYIGKNVTPFPVQVSPKKGDAIDFEINAQKIMYQGKPAIIASFRDITERLKSEREIIEKNEELEFINTINIAINKGKTLDEILEIICCEAGTLFQTTNATTYLLSKCGRYLIPKRVGLSKDKLHLIEKTTGLNISHHKIPLQEESYYSWIMKQKKPQLIADKNEIIRLAADYTDNTTLKKFSPPIIQMLNIKSTMLVPLLSEGECIGLIDISASRHFTQNDLTRFSRIAEQLSTAIGKIQAEKQVQEARKELERLNKSLEKMVEQRTNRIQQLLQQKDDFINQLGHDLKNPLGPLINLLPVIEKSEKDPPTKEMLQIINRNVRYMKNLVIKTIELARLNSPNTEFNYETTNLYELTQEVVNNNQLLLTEKNIHVDNHIPKHSNLQIDKLRIQELFTNLLNNSIKYSDKQGKISITASDEPDCYTIAFADNGIGMTQEQINHIFDEFYKADKSRHDFDSSGLGMPICKRIVERHGGTIWAESQGIGKGSTIYFTINKKLLTKDIFKEPSLNKLAKSNRISTIEYKTKNILILNYSNLNEKDYSEANSQLEQYLTNLDQYNLLILTDITGIKLSREALLNSKKMSANIKKYIKKNAVIGLPKSQSVFLNAMQYFTDLEIKNFDNITDAKEWLIAD